MIWYKLLYYLSSMAHWFGMLVALSILNDILTGHYKRDDLHSFAKRYKRRQR